jgi:hypothetical protein
VIKFITTPVMNNIINYYFKFLNGLKIIDVKKCKFKAENKWEQEKYRGTTEKTANHIGIQMSMHQQGLTRKHSTCGEKALKSKRLYA